MPEPTHTVTHRRSLLQLQEDGLIKEPPEHCRPKGGRWGTDYHYVDEGTLGASWVKWRGYEVRCVYLDGCFFPFVQYRHTCAA